MKCPHCNGTGEMDESTPAGFLRAKMAAKNISQAKLAKAVGLAPQQVSHWFAMGEKVPSKHWRTIAYELDIDLGELAKRLCP